MSNLSKHIVDLSINYLYTPGRTEQAQRLVIVYLQNTNDEKMKYLFKLDIHWNLLVQFIIEFQTKLDRITIYNNSKNTIHNNHNKDGVNNDDGGNDIEMLDNKDINIYNNDSFYKRCL